MTKKQMKREENSMREWSDIIHRCFDAHEKRNKDYLNALGKPTMFIPTNEPRDDKDKSGVAFWRVKGGVIQMYVHYSGKPDVDGRHTYDEDFIHILTDLMKLRARRS